MYDIPEDAPVISTRAETLVHEHERIGEEVPVIEGDDTLTGIITGHGGRHEAKMYLVQSSYFHDVAVIAGHEQVVWDYLADFGVLDNLQMDEEEARELEEEGHGPMRLGNASEPFDIDDSYHVVSQFYVEDIQRFHSRLTFNADGWMHLWANNPHNDEPPYTDMIVQLDDDFSVDVGMDFRNRKENGNPRDVDKEHAEDRAHKRIWKLINEHC